MPAARQRSRSPARALAPIPVISMDFWMVSARNFFDMLGTDVHDELDLPAHELRLKRGGGEGGTTPALAVVVNAVVDALSDYGVTHLEMPLTAERVWRAIRDGKAKTA